MKNRDVAGLILVVEDNFGLYDLVTTILELDPSLTTAKAEGGEHALAMARAMRPALVVLDARPPKLGALEAARRLKADPTTRTIPLVGMTSEFLSGIPLDACDHYVTRPYDLAKVVERLKGHFAA